MCVFGGGVMGSVEGYEKVCFCVRFLFVCLEAGVISFKCKIMILCFTVCFF